MVAVTPLSLTYNTAYAVDDGESLVLVDTGPDYAGAFDSLLDRLPRLPDLVVATHAHVDHAGLGHWWQERGVPVAVGQADAPLTLAPQFRAADEVQAMVDWVASIGAPATEVEDAAAGLWRRRDAALAQRGRDSYPQHGSNPRWPTGLRFEPFHAARTLTDGEQLPCGLTVLASPGHTPGNLVLVHRAEGWLFSGDQLLPDITPTPAVQFRSGQWDQRFPSLPAFLASLARLQGEDVTRCFPGHGAPFDDAQDAIALNIAQIEQRTAKVRDELASAGPATVYGLAERMYRRALQRRFWQITSTLQGHLDLLEARGQARLDGTRYRAT
ncbi:MAG: MBL fold metallo-hydrolase [Dehalococcoidia bacterium]